MNPPRRRPFLALAVLLCTALPALAAIAEDDGVFTNVLEATVPVTGARLIQPRRYRVLTVERGLLGRVLAAAPDETLPEASFPRPVIALPLPDGRSGRFLIEESPVMGPALAAKFPEIRTFRGRGLDDPTATVRIDRTPAGFHAMILSASGSIYIDPLQRGDDAHVISYDRRDAVRPSAEPFECATAGAEGNTLAAAPAAGGSDGGGVAGLPNGGTLKTYRLAVAATGEYTAFHGGTVPLGMAAIVTAMNRVDGVYERDVAVRMVLVANNNLIVYTNASTDPYTNSSGSAMLGQNQSNLNTVIGTGNYDIGHVFSTAGGGVAVLGAVCSSSTKAEGVTGTSAPVGDPFTIDYVAHEMGHQWGANHSFNGNAGSCSGGNRNSSTAYEPGSGTTIMAYAGICGSQDLAPHSDDDFHAISYQEIVNFITVGNGKNCPVSTATGNTPPAVDAGAAFTIPIGTPFTLCGTASDVNGDTITYDWDEFDLGSAGAPNSPSGNAPIFRSFVATTNPCRTFPQQSDLLNNTQTIGEILPSYARTLNFRLTARDNRAGGGGADYDTTSVTVTNTSGPFLVTAPNTAVTWPGGSTQTVTWNAANTTVAPVSCANATILLSTDGGQTFPTVLLATTPNDGSQSVTAPNLAATQARVKVACANNVFFDLSNVNFTITSSAPPAAGAVPDTVNSPGIPLTVARSGGSLVMNWGASCVATDTDYSVYEGTIGSWASHTPRLCSTGGATGATIPAPAGSAYYLVVPRNGSVEGSYGLSSAGAPRPPAVAACKPQAPPACN